jgi:hypothetical protein
MKLQQLFFATLACSLHAAAADPLPVRDPMQPPAAARAALPAAAQAATQAAPAELPTVRHLLLAGGRRQWVLEGGRRLAEGERVVEGRIERIDDSAVYLRTAAGLQRLPLFPGVNKRPTSEAEGAASTPRHAAPARSARSASPTRSTSPARPADSAPGAGSPP